MATRLTYMLCQVACVATSLIYMLTLDKRQTVTYMYILSGSKCYHKLAVDDIHKLRLTIKS